MKGLLLFVIRFECDIGFAEYVFSLIKIVIHVINFIIIVSYSVLC